jgi:hypothetical protein
VAQEATAASYSPEHMAAAIAALSPASVCVVERGRNPSSDYYLHARVKALGVPVVQQPEPGSLVVIVRYLDSLWRRRIEAVRESLAGVAYFMDDDLLDLGALSRPPLQYAARMFWLAWRHQSWLREIGAQLWVSTPYLAQKYRDWSPQLVGPLPASEMLQPRRPVRVFYHGTGLHRDEIRWLEPVVRNVQQSSAATWFEFFGPAWVNRLYRDVPRVSVVHPMGWENYQRYTASGAYDIGLAPLLPHAFNAARSHTRFFDFARCGAAGVYSKLEPYASFVRDGIDGLLVANERKAWTEAVLRLASDRDLRERISAQAAVRAHKLALN